MNFNFALLLSYAKTFHFRNIHIYIAFTSRNEKKFKEITFIVIIKWPSNKNCLVISIITLFLLLIEVFIHCGN